MKEVILVHSFRGLRLAGPEVAQSPVAGGHEGRVAEARPLTVTAMGKQTSVPHQGGLTTQGFCHFPLAP